ncbi:diaminopimelate decarboxylase [Aquimarina hainanensis]|uniref:Diaminopimelate decarboxylase n=1 Tax=Aquimarina hainanensis TaxID=1578017 RepID=A0ABW5NCB7_9FLAO|nr:diaminopimelate decarboxylase [Aquimarina sp. TRL1]QKX06981.1 diaminopimelate decarboxylase [Aquimarina sp. TRL1]
MQTHKSKILKAVEAHGTPSYVYDGEQLVHNYHNLVNALPDCVDVFYALKVNPNVSLVKLLRSEGACTEVCSVTEMEIALKAGSTPQDIVYLGPCKKDYELKRAIELGVFAIVIESETELYRVSKFAEAAGKVVEVAIRINPDFSAKGSPWKMGGRPTQFGIDEKHAVKNFGSYLKVPHVHIKGIHVYNGTNILDAQSVYENSKYILGLYEQISEKYQVTFSMVDVGGGMGIPYFPNQVALDIDEFRSLMVPLFSDFHKKYPNTRIIMESGRFIIGTAGYFGVTVNNIKVNHGKTFVVTDGGTNCHSASAGAGRVVKRNFPMENISSDSEKTKEYQVAGPLCSPDDIIGRNMMLKETREGDVLVISGSGAYGPSSSPGLFHSHGFPAEVLVYQDKVHLIRKRDTSASIISQQVEVDFSKEVVLQ